MRPDILPRCLFVMIAAVAAAGMVGSGMAHAHEHALVEEFTAEVEATIIAGTQDDNGNEFERLYYPSDMSTISINDRHYAVVTSSLFHPHGFDGMQIIDITDPSNPLAVASMGASPDTLRGFMDISTITIDGKHYSVTTGFNNKPDGIQPGGIQIANITNPAKPVFVSSAIHGEQDANGNIFGPLVGPTDIATITVGKKSYVAVTSAHPTLHTPDNNGVKIIDISNPSSPLVVSSIDNGTRDDNGNAFTAMDIPVEIDTITISGDHYLLVLGNANPIGTNLEIVNINNPEKPLVAANLKSGSLDNDGNTFGALHFPLDISTATIADRHYALIVHHIYTSPENSGVEILDITDPANPLVIKNITAKSTDANGRTFEQLSFAKDAKLIPIDDRYYVLVLGNNPDYGGGIEIIDVTDPGNPLVAGAILHGTTDANGEAFHFDHGEDINAITIDGIPHVLVSYVDYANSTENGVQILKLSHMLAPGAGPAPTDALESRIASLEMLLADLKSMVDDLTARVANLQAGMPDPAQALLSGIVYMDANGNDRYDSGEAGVPGLGVIAVDLSDHSSTTTAVTDSDGMYAFDGLDSGSYLVQIVGYDIYNYVTIPAGQPITQNFAFP